MNKSYMLLEDIKHCLRVGKLAYNLAQTLNLSEKEIKDIYVAATLHDIGKALLDKDILNKPGKLTEEEYMHIKNHVGYGAQEALGLEYSKIVADYILYHHENHDGSGYIGLRGKEIPVGAAIIRICDTYDAILMKRPYKNSLSHNEAIEEIIKTKKFYNPIVFEVFLKMLENKEKGCFYEKVI